LNSDSELSASPLHKGIALFTPGGDLIYCIDPNKRDRWHLHLCVALQEALGLLEPPHFLVPCYTATIDRWYDPRTGRLMVSAEAYPPVLRYQSLLNAIFKAEDLEWQPAPCPVGVCDPMILLTHRQQFPELWLNHDLVMRLDKPESHVHRAAILPGTTSVPPSETEGYVLRLFVSGHNAATERILQNLHQLLEQNLDQPYTLKVIDVFKHPEAAEADQVSATPTLVRVYPQPVRRIAGNLEDVDRVLKVLSSSRAQQNW
jgi:circadian clock protein KaiB